MNVVNTRYIFASERSLRSDSGAISVQDENLEYIPGPRSCCKMKAKPLMASKTYSQNFVRIRDLWEVVGPLRNLRYADGYLVAKIGKLSVCLPPEMASELYELRGKMIGIARISDPTKTYWVRVIGQSKPVSETISSHETEERMEVVV